MGENVEWRAIATLRGAAATVKAEIKPLIKAPTLLDALHQLSQRATLPHNIFCKAIGIKVEMVE